MKLLTNKKAVSHLVGYLLTLSITASVVSVALIATNSAIDDKASVAATKYAENLAHGIADAIVNVCIMKDQYPETDYSVAVDLPSKLVNRYDYYVELTQSNIYINSTDGRINVNSTTYNTPANVKMDLSGKFYGSSNKLTFSCEKTDYVYKFDFGKSDSPVSPGYIKITNKDKNDFILDPDLNLPGIGWKYVSKIKITNPLTSDIPAGYQILIQLDETNFNHDLANPDGSDLRFYDDSGTPLDFWIECWYYPNEVHTSRVWVKLEQISAAGDDIYMYYGNEFADFDDDPLTGHYGGNKTFLFFDDFAGSELDLLKWTKYPKSNTIEINNGILYLEQGDAVSAILGGRFPEDKYIIDVKAKSEKFYREANMFVRYDTVADPRDPPYHHSLVFSSSNLTYWLDLIYLSRDEWAIAGSGTEHELDDEWNRLRCTINGNDTLAVRYFYDSFSYQGYALSMDYTEGSDVFGLCTLQDSGTEAQYDWIFAHKFVSAKGEVDGFVEPTAQVQETYSQNFEWSAGTVNTDVDDNGIDFVSGSEPATFLIKDLTISDDYDYSVTFALGQKETDFNTMKIDLIPVNNEASSIDKITVDVGSFSGYLSVWQSNIHLSTEYDNLQIKFYAGDDDNGYWAVDEMTLELSDRTIKVEGG